MLPKGKNNLIFLVLYEKSPQVFPNQNKRFGKTNNNKPTNNNKEPVIINNLAIKQTI